MHYISKSTLLLTTTYNSSAKATKFVLSAFGGSRRENHAFSTVLFSPYLLMASSTSDRDGEKNRFGEMKKILLLRPDFIFLAIADR